MRQGLRKVSYFLSTTRKHVILSYSSGARRTELAKDLSSEPARPFAGFRRFRRTLTQGDMTGDFKQALLMRDLLVIVPK